MGQWETQSNNSEPMDYGDILSSFEGDWYELGIDDLPPVIDDIRGNLYKTNSDVDKVYGMISDFDNNVYYVGLLAADD